MAPMEPDLTNSNTRPYLYFASYLVATTGLIALVTRNVIYKPYKSLPPSQDTRWRQSNRQRHVRIMAALAGLSLLQAIYHLGSVLLLSYQVWAHEMGQSLPARPYSFDSLNELMLGRWLTDLSPLAVDAWEIVVESSARYWWVQQLFLGSGAWAVYVGIEGRRRNISHLWAFLLLAPLVSRAFAMNLFFLAILSTPIPQPPKVKSGSVKADQLQLTASGLTRHFPNRLSTYFQKIRPYLPPNPFDPHPSTWHPHPWSVNLQLAALFFQTWLLPYTTSTPHFPLIVFLNLAVLFRLAYPHRLGALAYGSSDYTPTQITSHQAKTARFIALVSFILFLKQTIVALLDSDPGAHRHRHSSYLAALHLPHESERSPLVRSTSAIGGVLAALNDHPATARLGYDVLLCAASLITWAAIRGLDVTKILAALGLAEIPPPSVAVTGPAPKKRTRKRKSSTAVAANATSEDAGTSTAVDGTSPDATYQPPPPSAAAETTATATARGQKSDRLPVAIWQGEEESEENGEAGAVAGVSFVLGGLGVLSAGVLGAEEL